MNLHAAIEAARAESADAAAGSSATRRSVLAAIERSPRRRLHIVVAAVIASMFGASAFAYYARAPHRERSVTTQVANTPSTRPSEPGKQASTRRAEIAEPEPAIAPGAELAPTSVAEVTPVTEVPTRVRVIEPVAKASVAAPTRVAVEPAMPVADSAPAMPATEAAPAAQRDQELAMYRAAHQLHFRDRNLAAALDAWNRYLAAAPDGNLAPEARFNRVVALVKLERWDDAARALGALADSTYRANELVRLRAVVSSHVARVR